MFCFHPQLLAAIVATKVDLTAPKHFGALQAAVQEYRRQNIGTLAAVFADHSCGEFAPPSDDAAAGSFRAKALHRVRVPSVRVLLLLLLRVRVLVRPPHAHSVVGCGG